MRSVEAMQTLKYKTPALQLTNKELNSVPLLHKRQREWIMKLGLTIKKIFESFLTLKICNEVTSCH